MTGVSTTWPRLTSRLSSSFLCVGIGSRDTALRALERVCLESDCFCVCNWSDFGSIGYVSRLLCLPVYYICFKPLARVICLNTFFVRLLCFVFCLFSLLLLLFFGGLVFAFGSAFELQASSLKRKWKKVDHHCFQIDGVCVKIKNDAIYNSMGGAVSCQTSRGEGQTSMFRGFWRGKKYQLRCSRKIFLSSLQFTKFNRIFSWAIYESVG